MAHAVSVSFTRFERMSPTAAAFALLLHALVAFMLWWTSPLHQTDEPEEKPIEVTMEAPPEKKPAPEPPKPEPPKPPPQQAEQPKPPQPKPQPQPPTTLPGLVAPGAIGPKDTAPPMERGETTRKPPGETPEKSDEKAEPPQQAMAKPEAPAPAPPPPPPAPTLEKELPPVEAPPAPLTSRDMPATAPPVPKPEPPKPEPPKQPPPPQAQRTQPAPQTGLAPSPLSHLPRNSPAPRQGEQPRSTFVNPADTYAMNTIATSYQQKVAIQISRYQADLRGIEINDFAVARFTIARNGALLSVSIVSSSGKQNLDRGLVAAFQQESPFPPLPPELPGESRTFTLTFGPRYRQR